MANTTTKPDTAAAEKKSGASTAAAADPAPPAGDGAKPRTKGAAAAEPKTEPMTEADTMADSAADSASMAEAEAEATTEPANGAMPVPNGQVGDYVYQVPASERPRSLFLPPKTKPPSRANILLNKGIVRGNVWIYRKTKGRVLGRFGSLEALLITTQGKKTGKKRTNPVGYLYDRGRFVIVAAYGGEVVHPSWYRNLRAVPKVTVELGVETVECTAHTEPPGPERDRLWKALVAAFPNYATFQNRTDRLLPVVVLTPNDLKG